MDEIIQLSVQGALFALVFLMIPASVRALRGPTTPDRILGIDLLTTMLIGIMVLLAYLVDEPMLVDLGLALAALSFIATLAVARYISEGRVF